ncbi:hypothetical protein FRC04_011022 [Tulasnella sp. 424]|nr:hypothetical protein FRC04_011022 [Tulasnella sp. 424]KAG8978345.1 hypothetical protein FRC05_010590 [Tulasnella sp. 425]
MASNLEFTLRIRVNVQHHFFFLFRAKLFPADIEPLTHQADETPQIISVQSVPLPQVDAGAPKQTTQQAQPVERSKSPDPTSLTLERPLDYSKTPFKFAADGDVIGFQFPPKTLVKILGGARGSLVWIPAKQDGGERQAYLRPTAELNPFRPRSPGAHGFVVGSVQEELSRAGVNATQLPLFLTGDSASYAGVYTWQDVAPLSYREWSRLDETFKQNSIARFLTYKERLVQIKVAQWKACGYWPSDAEVNEDMDYTRVTAKDIALAIKAEFLRIPLSALRCIGYNHNYVRELKRKASLRSPKGKKNAPTGQSTLNRRAKIKEAVQFVASNTRSDQQSLESKRQLITDSADEIQELPITKTNVKVGPPPKKRRRIVEVVIPIWPKRDGKIVTTTKSRLSNGRESPEI